MVREALVSDSVDPLSGLSGPSLFPRTIRASADAPVPADPKDLDSIHNFMKSLELRSPLKLLNEAKKIVDGGAELLESNLVGFTENVGATNAIAAKGKDKPQERRPGLGLARKRAPFSLRTSISQPPVNLEPTLDIDHLQDPDEFFDAYERVENAKKEIQKQLGGSVDNINLYKPSNKERRRRPGILGKSYNYKHRYSSTPAENDDMWMSSQETVYVDIDIPSAPKDESQKKLVHRDSRPDADIEEVELAASNKKTESEVNDILEELLSCNDEDLEGHGALNLLQERLKIKPLDRENLYMPDVGRTNIPTASESWQRPHKSSVVIDSVLRNLSRKPLTEQQLNHVTSPTPPRSPLTSISLLKKKILQRNPLADPFSPLNIGISSHPNASAAQPTDKILGQIDAHKDKGMSSEFDSHAEFGDTELPISNADALEVVENADGLPEQFVPEDARIQRVNDESRPNASPTQTKDKLLGQVDELKDLDMSSNAEPTISKMGAQDAMGNVDSLPELAVDENASMQNTNFDSRLNEESNDNIGKTMKANGTDKSNPSVLEEESRDDASQQIDPEQPSEVHAAKPHKGKRVAGKKRIRNAHPMKKNLADESNPYVLEEETRTDTSSRQQIDSEQLPEFQVDAAKPLGEKRVGVKRIRDAHPMRKSLAEAGTTFENGVRRSKRIRMRPLEYWKGERFVYGCVGNSFKLIGVKYLSPDKNNVNLKVKPYISSETPEIKELLDLAARH